MFGILCTGNSPIKHTKRNERGANLEVDNMKRDIADKLYSMVYECFREEQPERELTHDEMDSIWFTIYGKLSRGETESEVKEWCLTTPLGRPKDTPKRNL